MADDTLYFTSLRLSGKFFYFNILDKTGSCDTSKVYAYICTVS